MNLVSLKINHFVSKQVTKSKVLNLLQRLKLTDEETILRTSEELDFISLNYHHLHMECFDIFSTVTDSLPSIHSSLAVAHLLSTLANTGVFSLYIMVL